MKNFRKIVSWFGGRYDFSARRAFIVALIADALSMHSRRLSAWNAWHWIWDEGCPADIAPFEGLRIVLLGPSPYIRNWSAGRQFQGMRGELTIERVLDSASVNDWLHRLIHAPR
jgi:hypothetical protein